MSARTKPPRVAEYLTEELADVDRRLRNWARWSKGGIPTSSSHCGSVEHKYVPNRDDEKQERQERQATEGVDALDAELVEAVVAALPRRDKVVRGRRTVVECRERVLVRSYYLRGHNWRETCRHLGRDPQMFASEHVRALTVVGNALRAASIAADSASKRRPARAA
jgi:hypothetical protein